MMTNSTRTMFFMAAMACVAACGDDDGETPAIDAAVAAGTTFTVSLTKAQEVTSCPGAGDTAAGSATVTVSADNAQIVVSNFTYAGLSGTATAAHIHAAVSGMNGPPVLAFPSAASPISKTFVAADYTAGTGAPADFAAFVTALKAGGAYLNLHTMACAGGEVRGQIR